MHDQVTFVAASGDELVMTCAGTCEPGMPTPDDLVTCQAVNRYGHAADYDAFARPVAQRHAGETSR